MSETSYLQAIQRREHRAFAARMKLGVSMLTTFGYSIVATALFDPLIKGTRFSTGGLGLIGVGAILFFVALYIVPQGEAS
jgi:hypothetical protein